MKGGALIAVFVVVLGLVTWGLVVALSNANGVPARRAFEARCREQGLFLQTDRPYLNCVDGEGNIHSQITG